ncbi:VOC family protein [Gilvimarinus sp. F26214L]|uniref:VOC family protein n=1 Tax=Gilvimarinus sp. DZF01 TaxID=3461371 RepID=UPI004045AE96
MKPDFKPGRNIAMKVPSHEYDQTLRFYRQVLGFKELTPNDATGNHTPRFEFGDKVLWLDRVPGISQAELWLEVVTNDLDGAADYLKENECARRDEIEPLPEGFRAFWLSSPANIIHLVSESDPANR